jgi:hypothetical protein
MKFRKKPVEIEATQWFKNGDHPEDYLYAVPCIKTEGCFSPEQQRSGDWEGQIVRRFRHPLVSADNKCEHCARPMHVHGWIDTLEGGHIVCPGDWVITGIKGEHYPCKPDIFEQTYDKVD